MRSIPKILEEQRLFFKSHKTKAVSNRIKHLKKLLAVITDNRDEICDAIHKDFKKSAFESIVTETALVSKELRYTLKHLKKWSRPERVRPALANFPSGAKIYPEPYGVVLILAPWNYPFQLALNPLIAAIAAGNTAVVKPSENTPHTAQLIARLLSQVFDPNYVTVTLGGVDTAQNLLKERWDYIFFTGSVKVGKIVAQAAAKHLTPVTLELGGKNPCIIDETANIALTAKRVVWGKFVNSGQTCIAPDYILVHKSCKDALIKNLIQEIEKAYGNEPQNSPDYPRIVNRKNLDRLLDLLENEKILHGGTGDTTDLYLAPTLIDEPNFRESELMKDEIFGPILPIISYTTEEEINTLVSHYEKPLSLYIFSSNNDFIKRIIKTHSFGGGAINDCMIQFVNHNLPFGGVGESGLGAYHGRRSFKTFSHFKPIVKRGNWFDPNLRYAPYTHKLSLIKKLARYI